VLPLMAALAEARPGLSLLLTTGTVTSAKLAAERLMPGAVHQYAPLDAPEYVRSFLDHWRPDLAVFTESEIWPNLILESSARDIPLALVNARMTKRSFRRWRRNPSVARPLFSRFSLVLAQNENLAHRFKTLGATSAVPTGNLKVDAPAPLVNQFELERLRPTLDGRSLLIAASTHEGEDQIIADAHSELRRSLPSLCTIIAPRHPERGGAIAQMLKGRGLSVAQRSLGDLARPQQRRLCGRYDRRARHALQAGARGLHRRVAGRPRRAEPHRGGAAGRRRAARVRIGRISAMPTGRCSAIAARSWCARPRSWPAPPSSCCPTRRSSAACAPVPARRSPPSRARCRALSRRCCATCRARNRCVRLDEPSWWYREAPAGMAASLLSPVGAAYGQVARVLYERGTPYRCRLPVVCVGNFTAGGTGKTPLALHICQHLKRVGHEPVALTRGYGGGLTGPYWVNAGAGQGARRR
jgi:hypothetical protein